MKLKFNHQINFLPDKLRGVAESNSAASLIVEHHHVDSCLTSCSQDPASDRSDEGKNAALCGITEAVTPSMKRLDLRSVSIHSDPFDQFFANQSCQQPEYGDFVKSGSSDNLTQLKNFLRRMKRLENGTRARYSSNGIIGRLSFCSLRLWIGGAHIMKSGSINRLVPEVRTSLCA